MIYADNGSTSFPKPKIVSEEMVNYIENIGGSPGRGGNFKTIEASRKALETRILISNLFYFDNPLNVVFTSNITESLNTIIRGYLKPGYHAITTVLDHNSVLRPLNRELKNGCEITYVGCDFEGNILLSDIENAIKPNTKLLVLTHVSNVIGTILPIEEIGEICKSHNIHFVLDTAQSAGILDVDFYEFNLSALTFTGHKGLLGPQGIGGFLIRDDFKEEVPPLKEGGTGSFSEEMGNPDIMPDKYECGTLNLPGICGLNGGINFINEITTKKIRSYENEIGLHFLEEVLRLNNIEIIGKKSMKGRTNVFSINFLNYDNNEAGNILEKEYGIITRTGLHCAPLCHKAMDTFPEGTVRFSFGYFNTHSEIDEIITAINSIK